MLLRFRATAQTALVGLAAIVALVISAGALNAGSADEPFAFQTGSIPYLLQNPTALTFGPDDRLYVAHAGGILAFTLDPVTWELLGVEEISADEGVLGMTFDPFPPPGSSLTLYASRQEPADTPGYWGRISTYTAPDWTREDIITGLPSSAPRLNHMTNGITFDADGRLLIAQGSNTDSGIADPPGTQDYYPESPLSGAILIADIHAPDFDGAITYDPPGEPVDVNVDQASGDVRVFAPGIRNPFDLVVHSNGHLYATDNGATGISPPVSCTEVRGSTSTSDELNLVEEGNYYGFPNLNRGRSDPRQCVYHAPEEGDGADFTGPIAILPAHCSCDGILEYRSTAFNGALRGNLIYTEFIRRNITRAVLSEDGRSVESTEVIARDLGRPLDITEAPDGTLFVTEHLDGRVSYLMPAPPAGTPTPTPTLTPSATPTATATPTPSNTPTPPGPPGDADCNGVVSSIDALLVLQFVAELIDDLGCPLLADMNANGRADAVDAALILQTEAGLLG